MSQRQIMKKRIAAKRNSCYFIFAICLKETHKSRPFRKSIPIATSSISYIKVYITRNKQHYWMRRYIVRPLFSKPRYHTALPFLRFIWSTDDFSLSTNLHSYNPFIPCRHYHSNRQNLGRAMYPTPIRSDRGTPLSYELSGIGLRVFSIRPLCSIWITSPFLHLSPFPSTRSRYLTPFR